MIEGVIKDKYVLCYNNVCFIGRRNSYTVDITDSKLDLNGIEDYRCIDSFIVSYPIPSYDIFKHYVRIHVINCIVNHKIKQDLKNIGLDTDFLIPLIKRYSLVDKNLENIVRNYNHCEVDKDMFKLIDDKNNSYTLEVM